MRSRPAATGRPERGDIHSLWTAGDPRGFRTTGVFRCGPGTSPRPAFPALGVTSGLVLIVVNVAR
ncbi:hypothetical protein AB0O28_20105 [Microbispora sp. NPDC088329]|uniref:hypothetical protein n=1 Tax=Microbispora sp. NPDC088329 TaxID=3154869 RepID=UPI003448B0B3